MILRIILIIILGYIIYNNLIKKKENYVGNLRVSNETDQKRAVKYALEMLCKNRGYKWIQGGSEFVYDCKHTKETCEKESVYPTPDKPDAIPRYYEWRDPSSDEFYETGEGMVEFGTGRVLSGNIGMSSQYSRKEDIIRDDGVCIIGNEPFRKFCEKEDLQYDKNSGKCLTTKKYCNSKLLPFCNNDCFEPPGSLITSKVFGTTIARSFGGLEYLTYEAACNQIQEKKNI